MAQQAQEDAPLHAVASPALSGWHTDPTGRFQWRYWDGTQWTDWVASDGVSGRDQFVSGPGVEEQQKLAYLRAYVAGAVARGVLPKKAAAALDADVANWQSVPEFGPPASIDLRPDQAAAVARLPEDEPHEPPQRGLGESDSGQVASEWSVPTWLAPDRWSAPERPESDLRQPDERARDRVGADQVVPSPLDSPQWVDEQADSGTATRAHANRRVRAWFRNSMRSLSAEFALHGLADLGALLLFAGLFGFVAFAFDNVRPGERPIAELAIPVAAFGAGWFLRRRGTRSVGDVLIVVGGALLPVVVIASLSDGASPPPDLTGGALEGALTTLLLTIAAIEVLLVRREPTSPLRFVMAPTAWLAVAAVGLGAGRSVPSGSDLASPSPTQWAIVAVAIVLTVAGTKATLGARWSKPVVISAWPSLGVAYLLTLLSAQRDGWPPWPVLAVGIAAVIGIDLLASPRHHVLVSGLQLTVLTVTASALSQELQPGWIFGGLAVALVALAEIRHRKEAPRGLVLFLLGASAFALFLCTGDVDSAPAALAISSAVLWIWSAVQTRNPTTLRRDWAELLTVVLAIPFVAGLAEWTSRPIVTLVSASIVVIVAIITRVLPASERRPWPAWVVGAGLAALLIGVLSQLGVSSVETVVAGALLIAAFAVVPQRREVTVGTVAAALVVTVAAAADWLGWTPDSLAPAVSVVAGVVLLGAALALRRKSISRSVWVAVASIASLINAFAVLAWFGETAGRYPEGLGTVLGTGACAGGLALAAAPSNWPRLRDISIFVGIGAALLLIPTLSVDSTWIVGVSSGVALVGSLARVVARGRERVTPWNSPLFELGLVGATIAVGASFDAGDGWGPFAWLVFTLVAVLLTHTLAGATRVPMQILAAGGAVGAWLSLGGWLAWTNEEWVSSSAMVSSVVMVASSAAAWVTPRGRDWEVVAASSGSVVLSSATFALFADGVDRSIAGPWVAAALMVAGSASAIAAHVTRKSEFRLITASLFAGSVGVFLDAIGADPNQILVSSVAIGLLATATFVAVALLDRRNGWTSIAEGFAIFGAIGALATSPAVGPSGVAVALLLVGTELAAIGTVRQHPTLVYLAPAALCSSWLVFASEAPERAPSWFTVPAGLTILVTVGLARQQRRRVDEAPSVRLLSFIEVSGMVLMVAAPLVQMVQAGLIHVVESVILGVGLSIWGAATQVRRRLAVGIGTTVTAVGLLLIVPIADAAQRVSGPVIWLLVAGAGLGAIAAAAGIEHSRQGSNHLRSRLKNTLDGWE